MSPTLGHLATTTPRPQEPTGPQPRHVLHVLNGAGGGAAMTTLALIGALEARGIRSSAICDLGGSDLERERLSAAVDGRVQFRQLYWWNRKIRGQLWRRPLSEARQLARTGAGHRSVPALASFARAVGVDLVHTSTILNPEGALVAEALGVPHVWHVRELVGPGEAFPFWRADTRFAQHIVPNADRFVANSQICARLLARYVPRGRIAVVPNGVAETGLVDLAPPSEAAHRDGVPVRVAMVAGTGARWKRHADFIDAAALVDPALGASFAIVGHAAPTGTDPYTDALRTRVARTDLGRRFAFAGFDPDPVSIMGGIDVLVHPAADESFGRIVVEAMLAARPVVGVDAGGVGELLDHGRVGLVTSPGDVRGLAGHIEALVRDPARRAALGRAGRQHARDHYTLDAMVDGVLATYAQVLRARRAVPEEVSA